MRRLALCSLWFLTAPAWGAVREGRLVTGAPADSTVLENNLVTPGGRDAEVPPGGLDGALVRDQASIVSMEGGNVCVAVTTRTSADQDLGLSGFEVDLNRAQVWPDQKTATVEVADYDYTGRRTVVDLGAVGAGGGGGFLQISKPEGRVFRVVTRSWTACGAAPAPGEPVRLTVKVKLGPSMRIREDFVWRP